MKIIQYYSIVIIRVLSRDLHGVDAQEVAAVEAPQRAGPGVVELVPRVEQHPFPVRVPGGEGAAGTKNPWEVCNFRRKCGHYRRHARGD